MKENIQKFLSEVSALIKRFGLKIHVCADCTHAAPILYDFIYHCYYSTLKYNKDMGCYILDTESAGNNPNTSITKNEFFDYVKRQNIKCGYGWYGLIMSVLVEIAWHNKSHPNRQIQIGSIEEKQGILRITVLGGYPDSLKYSFDKAIEASTSVCEYCGCIGKLNKYNYGKKKTLCPECRKKYRRRKRFKKADAKLFEFMKKQEIDCELGWYGLIIPILSKIKEWNDKHPKIEHMKTVYFKEKFATLQPCFWHPPILEKFIDNAKKASARICEECGCLGNLYRDSRNWNRTLCLDCIKAQEKCDPDSEDEQVNNRREYIEKSMPEFLSELSVLTSKYRLIIVGNEVCVLCPGIVDMEYQCIEYSDLEYNYDTGCYTVEGFGQNENNEEPEDLKEV
jgi:hypothetical protein